MRIRFETRFSEGSQTPAWYGLAWTDMMRKELVMYPIPFHLIANLWWRASHAWNIWRHRRTWVDREAVRCYHQGMNEERERSKELERRAELAGYDRCLEEFKKAIHEDREVRRRHVDMKRMLAAPWFYCDGCFGGFGATESLTLGCLEEARRCDGCGRPVNCRTEPYHFVGRVASHE